MFTVKRRKWEFIKGTDRNFFEDDDVFAVSHAKSDQIVRKKVKKQKRCFTSAMGVFIKNFFLRTIHSLYRMFSSVNRDHFKLFIDPLIKEETSVY